MIVKKVDEEWVPQVENRPRWKANPIPEDLPKCDRCGSQLRDDKGNCICKRDQEGEVIKVIVKEEVKDD